MGRCKPGSAKRGRAQEWGADASVEAVAFRAKCTLRHAAFYKAQIGLPDEEWSTLMAAMTKVLPVTLRIAGLDEAHALRLEAELRVATEEGNALLETARLNGTLDADGAVALGADDDDAEDAEDGVAADDGAAADGAAADGAAAEDRPVRKKAVVTHIALTPLSWIRHGWHLDVPRPVIRKSPYHVKLFEWLKVHEPAGTITRQEAVSMVPPLFLQVVPGDRVFDSCAAPGSKTSQLIEALQAQATEAQATVAHLRSRSLVFANDANLKRAHTLVHQCKRLHSAAWLVSHADASNLPGVKVRGQKIKFDKVLCDVPCSSDGTLRKTPTLLGKWRCSTGTGLHSLQARIALRAALQLKPGGSMVYSTCSMNPVENEAVVAELLRQNSGLHVVDAAAMLPALRRRPGLTTWKVFDDDDSSENGLKEIPEAPQDDKRLRQSLFPPTEDGIKAELVRCMRFLPHDDDTGAFFVTLLVLDEAVAADAAPSAAAVPADAVPADAVPADAVPADAAPPTNAPTDAAPTDVVPADAAPTAPLPARPKPAGKLHKGQFAEDVPYLSFQSMADVQPLVDFYGLSGDFPVDLLVARAMEKDETSKKVVLVSEAVREIVLDAAKAKLRIVHAGVIVLCRTSETVSGPVDYRLTQDGIGFMLPFMSKRVAKCCHADFQRLLRGGEVVFAELSAALVGEIDEIDIGAVVCVLDVMTTPAPAIVAWRGVSQALTVYCSKNDLAVLQTQIDVLQSHA
ncbi:S-adenosyl-L-methionine-dependent methyltransferase [Pelagophyceae sp. CCMP2097]|nr:S-adenosyl-L-methionine-dependent methyltransferase [Pelagophyceae sp. CCMP2097]